MEDIKDQVIKHLRKQLEEQRKELSIKNEMIERLRKKIEQLESGQDPELQTENSSARKRNNPGRPKYKVTDIQVDEIKTKVAEGYSYRKIAKEYGITAGYVSKIISNPSANQGATKNE